MSLGLVTTLLLLAAALFWMYFANACRSSYFILFARSLGRDFNALSNFNLDARCRNSIPFKWSHSC